MSEPVAEEQQDLSRVPEKLRSFCFKKGESGNPGGRPKGSHSVVAPLRAYAAAEGAALAKALAEELLRRAFEDEAPTALLEILERLDGKVDKGIVNKGEPTVVVINGPKPVAPPPGNS